MNHIALTSFVLLTACPLATHGQDPVLQEHWWQGFDAYPIVNAFAVDSTTNTLFIGHNHGGFIAKWGPPVNSAYGAVLSTSGEGWPGLDHDSPDQIVRTAISDSSGGWFIGGSFTNIGAVARNGLARLNADGSLDTGWDPFNQAGVQGGYVNAMTIDNGKLYVGGTFTSAGGSVRPKLAAFDINTAALIPAWNAGFSTTDGTVFSLVVGADGTVYAGGAFVTVGAQARNRLAAFNAANGSLTTWVPDVASGQVDALAFADDRLYVGGNFGTVDSQTRNRIACFDATSGSLTPWNPNANSGVKAIAISGDTAYVGGSFSNIAGEQRSRIAALATGVDVNNAFAWAPSVDGTVNTIQVATGLVYLGGDFAAIGSVTRNRAATVTRDLGDVTEWDPHPWAFTVNRVYTLAYDGTSVYAGGDFAGIGVRERSCITAFDMNTGKPTRWSASFTSGTTVQSLIIKGDTLFAGGNFNMVNGEPRENMVALNKITGELIDWQVNVVGPGAYVSDMAVVGDTLYIGGRFETVNAADRFNMAAVLIPSAGVIFPWIADTDASGYVHELKLQDDRLYVGGQFASIDGTAQQYLAALNPTTGNLLPWSPVVSEAQNEIATTPDRIYVRANTTTLALDATTGAIDTDYSCASCNVLFGGAMEVGGDVLYTDNGDLLAVNRYTGVAASWNPNYGGTTSLRRSGDFLFVGGGYVNDDGILRPSLSVWEVNPLFEDLSTGQLPESRVPTIGFLPNPFAEWISVTGLPNNPVRMTLYDSQGRLVVNRLIVQQETINLQHLDNGLYQAILWQGDKRLQAMKLVKQ